MKQAITILMLACCMMVIAQTDTLINGHYTVVYSYEHNVPILVSWNLHKYDLMGEGTRKGLNFRSDKRLKRPRVSSSDYRKSGYQRGHMCPAGDWLADGQKMKATFLMSNIAPQAPSLNTGQWKQDEILTRYLALKFDSVHIECAPIFNKNTIRKIRKRNISIPDGYWKSVRLISTDSILFERYYHNR